MNKANKLSMIIPKEYCGQRLDVVLAQLLPHYSRSQLSHWLKAGLITINQHQAKPKDKVFGNEEINLFLDSAETRDNDSCLPEAIPLQIIHEDEQLIVLNKPAGLVVHPGAGNRDHTLVNALLYYHPSLQHLPRAGIIHRLDKETTGLLLVAKNLTAYTNLSRQMRARTIQRRYLALVQGNVLASGKITSFYGRHPRNRLKMAVCAQGKEAITFYSIHKRYANFTLLDIQLMTGRTHQIRVHMAHIKHPIVGDPLYGAKRTFAAKEITEELNFLFQQFHRQALHATSLSFQHPLSNESLTFTAPIPDDFHAILAALDKI